MRPVPLLLVVIASVVLWTTPCTGQQSKELSAEDVFAKCSKAVVRIDVYDSRSRMRGQGSGFFVSKAGLVVTNYHVIARAASANVLFSDGKHLPVKGLVASMPKKDLALLKVDSSDVPHLKLAARQPVVGAKVYAIGTPEGLTNTLSAGLVSGVRTEGALTLIQTTASITHGSSGGPLLNKLGRVVGVTTAGIGKGNLNFAVSLRHVRALLKNVKELKPLPATPPGRTTPMSPPDPKDPSTIMTYTSVSSIRSEMPKDMMPRYHLSNPPPEASVRLNAELREKWIEKGLVGNRFRLTSSRWKDASYETTYRVHLGRGIYRTIEVAPYLRIRLCARERGRDGSTYYVKIICRLDNPTGEKNVELAKKITSRKLGVPISIDGRIAAMHIVKGPKTVHNRKAYGVRRKSRSIELQPSDDPKKGTTFVDRKGINVYVALDDWHIPAQERQSKPAAKPAKPAKPKKPARKLTPDEKAERALRTARMYLDAAGQTPAMKTKAVEILRSIIADYPKTEAAKSARAELRKLAQ